MGGLISSLAFPVPPKEWAEDALRARRDRLELNTAEGKIAAIHIQRGGAFTILYSHGNAEDLGLSLPYLARIVAFGRSIGSGPTVDLVSRHREIRAMVLQSPLESGGRAVFGKTVAFVGYRIDIFKNYEKIDKV